MLDAAGSIRLVDACAEDQEPSNLACPLCKALMPTMKRWFKHLGHHLEQAALYALPHRLYGEDVDHEPDIPSSGYDSDQGNESDELDDRKANDPNSTSVSGLGKQFEQLSGELKDEPENASSTSAAAGSQLIVDAEPQAKVSSATARGTQGPNMAGWWACCECKNAIRPELHFCPICEHSTCKFCYRFAR